MAPKTDRVGKGGLLRIHEDGDRGTGGAARGHSLDSPSPPPRLQVIEMAAQEVAGQVRDPRVVLEGLDAVGLQAVLVQEPRIVRHLPVGEVEMGPRRPELELAELRGVQPLRPLQAAQERVGRLALEPFLRGEDDPVDQGLVHQRRPSTESPRGSAVPRGAPRSPRRVSSSRTSSAVMRRRSRGITT